MDKLALLAKADELTGKIDAAFAKADTEKRPLTAEERTQIGAWETEVAAVDEQIKNCEADEAARKRNAERKVNLKKVDRKGRKSNPDDDPNITRQHLNLEDDPKKGFQTPREFLAEVIRCGQGTEPDERLRYLSSDRLAKTDRNLAAGSDEARGNSDPAGGFLVPVGFSPQFLTVEPEEDPLGNLTRKIPMQQTIVKIPARTDKDHTTSVAGGITVTRKPETVSATSSQMTMEQVVLQALNLFGLSYATEELLTDSPLSFITILETGFAQQFTFALTKERLFGTGVGEYLGMASAQNPALLAIAKENNQPATTFLYQNAIKMRAFCWGYGRAIWIANHDTLPSFVLMNQAVGVGGVAVFQPGSRLSMADQDVPDMFLGRPLIFSEYPQTLGTQGDVILVNPNEYLEGQYAPLQSAESIHVRFVNHERTFKFWMRNAGQPWWKSTLTPTNSTNKMSPYVVCAAR